MFARRRVLVASRDLDFAGALHSEIGRMAEWRLIGVIDPRIEDVFDRTCAMADVLLIEADDLIWLWNNRREITDKTLETLHAVVILSEKQILDVVPRLPLSSGLLFRTAAGDVRLHTLEIALKGYMSVSEPLLDRMKQNHLRLEVVARFSFDERCMLIHIGNGLSNRQIAHVSGLDENRVKTLVHLVTRKLRFENRTAVAMFAVSNRLLDVISD